MAENQNDSRNQYTGNKSNQATQDSGKSKETNPNNPTANQGTDKSSTSKGSTAYQSGTQLSQNDSAQNRTSNKRANDEDENGMAETDRTGDTEERERKTDSGKDNDYSGSKGRM